LGYFYFFLPDDFFEDVLGFGVGYGDFVAEVEYGDGGAGGTAADLEHGRGDKGRSRQVCII
jgi:hypothetical protein